MSGLVNKVKEALHSSHDTPTGERNAHSNLTPEERQRQEAAGTGPSRHAEKQHLGGNEDTTRSASGHPTSHYLNQETSTTSAVPGAFPDSQSETIGSQHKDGREYVAPKGTHVGLTHDPQRGINPSSVQPTERGFGSNVQDANITDTRAQSTKHAVIGGETPAAAGSHETKTGPNKLHKREDPRGHVAFTDPPSHDSIHGAQTGTTATRASDTTAVHHSMSGSHPRSTTDSQDVYEQQAARKYDANSDLTSSNTPNYSYPTSTTAAVGAGALASSQLPERKRHDDTAVTASHAVPSQGHSTLTGTSHDQSPPRGVGVYNTVTGAGSQNDPTHTTHGSSNIGSSTHNQPFQSHPGLATGSHAVPREAGDSTIASGHGSTNTASSNAPLPATLTRAAVGSSAGSAIAHQPSTHSQSRNIAGESNTSSSTGVTGQDHFGPGHVGSRVLHTCTKCGEDNDITHYFKKESVYRLSQ